MTVSATFDNKNPYPIFLKGKNAYLGEFWLLSSEVAYQSKRLSQLIEITKRGLRPPPHTLKFTKISHKKLGFMCVRLILGQQKEDDFEGDIFDKPIIYGRDERIKKPSPLSIGVSQSDSPHLIFNTRVIARALDDPPFTHYFLPIKSDYPPLSASSTLETMPLCLSEENDIIHLKGGDAKEGESWVLSYELAETTYTLTSMLDDLPLYSTPPFVLNFRHYTHLKLGYRWVKLVMDLCDDVFDAPPSKARKKCSVNDFS